MRNILILVFAFLLFNFAGAEVISGRINHDDMNYQNRIVDSKTGKALSGAKITVPELNYTTYTDKNGAFKLSADISNKTVLLVEKEGYKTFSLTIDNSVLNAPLKLGIEQSSPFDLQITQSVVHLGDNMFSTNSANSDEFMQNAHGYFMSQTFKAPLFDSKNDVILKIGTIIGLDTKKAREFGQNKIAKVYSSPAEIFVNGHKIASLELNGDNIEIVIPKNALKATNELVIQTGKNLFQHEYTDYDDIELANVRIEIRQKNQFAKK